MERWGRKSGETENGEKGRDGDRRRECESESDRKRWDRGVREIGRDRVREVGEGCGDSGEREGDR